MISSIQTLLAVLASSGVVGISDQYLVLALVGLAVHLGLVVPAGPVAFIGHPWFIGVAVVGWLVTVIPAVFPHEPVTNAIVNFMSGPVSLVSGAVVALASAGMLEGVRPELAGSLYLLRRDAAWLSFNEYRSADLLVLGGGAAIAGGLTFMKFMAKPGIASHTGTWGTGAGMAFAATEAGLAVTLTPLMLWLQGQDPWLLIALGLVIALVAVFVLVVSIRWLLEAR
ncbi:MAG: hypothetical protein ACKVVP_06760, partial [Chloroflexota bacterium]